MQKITFKPESSKAWVRPQSNQRVNHSLSRNPQPDCLSHVLTNNDRPNQYLLKIRKKDLVVM